MSEAAVNILLVEDNAGDALLMKQEFAESPLGPFSTTHVTRLADALGRLDGEQFDAVLLDLGLPDSQGLDTLRQLQAHKGDEVAVVVVTGLEDEALRMLALKAGADDYLIKGVPTDSIRARAVRYAIERKRAHEAWRSSEQRLGLAVDAAQIAIFDWDLQRGKMTWSHQHAALLGLAGGRFGGTYDDFLQCVHPDDRAGITERLAQATSEHDGYRQDYRVIWPDGTVHWIAERGRISSDNQGRRVRMIGTIVDITQRKAAEELARSREAEMAHLSRVSTTGQMASSLAHELTQPLAAIVNYATACLAQMESPGAAPASAAAAIQRLLTEARRAGAVVNSMRSFVRKRPPASAPLDINQVARESVRMMEFEARHRGIRPRVQLAAGLPLVFGDAVQIEQVMVNLLLNALQAISEADTHRNELTVRTALHDQGRSVQVTVADTGPGISPEKMTRLFEPFFTTKPQGLGMGLSICRSIIESQGGQLTAAPNPDRGMRFSFTVPVAT